MPFLRKLKSFIAQINQDRHYAYYAFPALLTMLISFGILRIFIEFYPNAALKIYGIHVHHFTEGIFILMITGYLALWIENSPRIKYVLALFYGLGVGLTLDEFFMWLFLNPSKVSADQYSAVVVGAVVLLLVVLWPMGMSGLRKLFGINHHDNDQENKTVFD